MYVGVYECVYVGVYECVMSVCMCVYECVCVCAAVMRAYNMQFEIAKKHYSK